MRFNNSRHWNAYEYRGPNINVLPPERVIDDWEALQSQLLLELYKHKFQTEDGVRFPDVVSDAIADLVSEGYAVRHEAYPDEVEVASLFQKLTAVSVWWLPEGARRAGLCVGDYPDSEVAEAQYPYIVAELLSECKGDRKRTRRTFQGHLHVVDELGRRRAAPRPVTYFSARFAEAWDLAHGYDELQKN